MNNPLTAAQFNPSSTRRAVALGLSAWVVAPVLLTPMQASAQVRRPTPSQTEGPYYPVAIPKDSDFDLLKNGALAYGKGEAGWLSGTVVDVEGRAVRGAQVEIWQADADGRYDHPGDGNRADPSFQAFGKVVVGADGAYRFRTIKPVPYSGRTPHIHFKVKLGSRELLTSQLYVQGDPGNSRDFLWRNLRDDADRAALTIPFNRGDDGWAAQLPIVVRA